MLALHIKEMEKVTNKLSNIEHLINYLTLNILLRNPFKTSTLYTVIASRYSLKSTIKSVDT